MNVVVLVPYRGDGGHRDQLWGFCRAWWFERHPDWHIFIGESPPGPFQRSAAVNDAARKAGDWDVAIILDADVIVNPDAVYEAIELAARTGRMVLPHDERVDLNEATTRRILDGFRGNWRGPRMEANVWNISESSCVVVPKRLFDAVGGFDERFIGWGYEDTAFRIACEKVAGPPILLRVEVFHLWHPRSADAEPRSALRAANLKLLDEIRAADGLIPRIFHRTVPTETSPEIEKWWVQRRHLHREWDFRTYRDPIDHDLFPRTSPLWERCETGAQKADLIRLEALVQWGGVYVDADCRPLGSHEPLRRCGAYAAWEDETTIPNAVMGAVPGHPAMVEVLERAITGVRKGWDTYRSGVAITTEVFKGRDDMVIFPPGIFYPHHYLAKAEATLNVGPWSIEEHMWKGSWLTEAQHQGINSRQRSS